MTKSPSRIWLHVGAHRTGSTRLQGVIDANAETTAEFGISAFTPPRPDKRKSATFRSVVRRARKISATWSPLRKYLRRRALGRLTERFFQSTLPTVLISDENMLGDILKGSRHGFYYDAKKTLREIKMHLPAPVEKIFLAIRPYDDFLISSYAMSVVYRPCSKPLPPFTDLKPMILALERGWPALVADIQTVFPRAELHVWSCDDTPLSVQLSIMLGKDLASQLVAEEARVVNAAPTEEAIEYARLNSGREDYDPDATVERFKDGQKFAPLNEKEKAVLQSQFDRDVKTLRSSAGIHFWHATDGQDRS